jgi:hypothetical protein
MYSLFSLSKADMFWQKTGTALSKRMCEPEPLWLSTRYLLIEFFFLIYQLTMFVLLYSGLGVPWLHMRIDDTPKYYTHSPYKHI